VAHALLRAASALMPTLGERPSPITAPMLRWPFMQLSAIFIGLGEQSFTSLLRAISIGKLKTYQLYDRMKARLHLAKLNSETVRKAEPRFWTRLAENDEDFATDLSQAILVSHLDMIKAVLDELGIPNQDGFFDKDIDGAKYLTEGWQHKTYDKFKTTYPAPVLLFYINHLDWEVSKSEKIFQPTA
jgi:hypothetical protein